MDIFNTVASAIDLAERLLKTIDDFQKVPERMRRLQFDVKSLSELMQKLKGVQYQNQEQEMLIASEIAEIETTLKVLQNKINRQKQRPRSSALSRGLGRIKTQLKFDDMDEMGKELQKRKASLSLTINMLVLNTVGEVDRKMEQQQEAVAKAVATNEKLGADSRQSTKQDTPHITRKEFLDHLNAPNYAEDEIRVKVPAEGTAKWIYDREEYKKWEEDESSSSLHLVGKMGSGKSVLTKSIIKSLKSKQVETNKEESAVLYYFCSCVNRTDSPENILKGFISQFALEHEHVYNQTAGSNELLQSRRSSDNIGWSFEALWHIFSKMVQCSGLTSLYCVVDALDECASQSLDELLDLLQNLSSDKLISNIKIKLLFSSREYTHIMDSLDSSGSSQRLFIDPDLISSDIRIAMQGDIKNIQRRLKLEDDEVGTLQETILKKSDGMFLWVSLAAKDIMDNTYDATFETLEELIEDLPTGLKGLYEKNWVKLIESLPTAKIALANKVLTWVLLARRPLTISELTLALAIEPGQKEIPPPKKLLRNLSAFVLNYLAPFIEIISSNPETETPKTAEAESKNLPPVPHLASFKAIDNSKIRIVHQSAQEYLLEACKASNSRLEIDLREGHEAIARTCLTYLCCQELQLGWIDPEENDEGLYITTEEIRAKVEVRLNQYQFLGYASQNWSSHVRKCQYLPKVVEEREVDDVFQQAINFVQDFPEGHACAAQARQLLNCWDAESHYSPAPPLHDFAGKDILTVVNRLLRTPEKYIETRDLEDCTALHYAAQADLPKEHPEERENIIRALLKAGADPDASSVIGETPLSGAAAVPLPRVVNILLERGVLVNAKNKYGRTPLNEMTAVGSKEIVESLLDHGADIDSRDEQGFSPLLRAAGLDLWDTVKTLVTRKCDINTQCDSGWSCLHYAAEKGKVDVARFLLENGADVHIRTNLGLTPLHSSVLFDQKDVFYLLLQYGADVQVKENDGRTLLHSAAEGASPELFKIVLGFVKDVNAKATNSWAPLGFAARRGQLEITKILVENGADIKACEDEGYTALHIAVESNSLDVTRYLLDIWDDVDVPTVAGLSALSLACSKYREPTRPEIIQWLLGKGANPNTTAEANGMTPFHVACCEGVLVAAEILLKNGAGLEKPASFGLRPLCFACKQGNLDVAKFLYSKGALIDSGRSTGSTDFTPLELTCFNGHFEVVKWLIEQGAEVFHVTFSPILQENKILPAHEDIFRLLMKHSGDVDKTENGIDTPLHHAIKTGNLKFAKVILEHNPKILLLDSRGSSVFHLAVGQIDLEFWSLLTARSDPLQWVFVVDEFKQTPAQSAACFGSIESMRFLANICPKETFRISTTRDLWAVLNNGNAAERLGLLKNMQALDIDLTDLKVISDVQFDFNISWLYLNFEASVETLSNFGFDWNAKDIVGRTILHIVAVRTRVDLIKRVIGLGGSLSIRDNNFMTAFDLLMDTAMVAPGSLRPRPQILGPLFPPIRSKVSPSTKFPPPRQPPLGIETLSRTAGRSVSGQREAANIVSITNLIENGELVKIVPPAPASLPDLELKEVTPPSPDSPLTKPQAELIKTRTPSVASSESSSSSRITPLATNPLSGFPTQRDLQIEVAIQGLLVSPSGEILVDNIGATVLHAAARRGGVEIVEAILNTERGKEVASKKDANGWTPGMMAERSGWKVLSSRLMETEWESIGGERMVERATTKPEKFSTTFSGRDLTLSEGDLVVEMAADIDVKITRSFTLEGFKIQVVDKANSVVVNAPIPYQASEFYYEIEFLEDLEITGGAAIGLTPLTQNFNHYLPGWRNDLHNSGPRTSWGYHADNGFRYPGDVASSEPYGEPWIPGDTVGCGYNVEEGQVWFTKNGKYQGMAYTGVRGVLYPIVGLAGGGIKMRIHFDAIPPPVEERVEPIRLARFRLNVLPAPSIVPLPADTFVDKLGNVIRDRQVEEVGDDCEMID